MMRTTDRIFAIGCLLLALGTRFATAEQAMATWVSWVDAAGKSHQGTFQGRLDDGRLRGHVFEGNDRLAIDGSLDRDGSFSGEIRLPSGKTIGRLVAEFDGDDLVGTFVDAEGGEGTVSAPAECLAAEARQKRGHVDGRAPAPKGCDMRGRANP